MTVHLTSFIPVKWGGFCCLDYEIKDATVYLAIKAISPCLFLQIPSQTILSLCLGLAPLTT